MTGNSQKKVDTTKTNTSF